MQLFHNLWAVASLLTLAVWVPVVTRGMEPDHMLGSGRRAGALASLATGLIWGMYFVGVLFGVKL